MRAPGSPTLWPGLKPILNAKTARWQCRFFTSASTIQHWEYLGNATGLRGVDLVFGLELEKEQDAGNARDNEGYYMELLSDFSDRFFINAGARHDRNSAYGSHTSYRIGSAWLWQTDGGLLKLKASYGTGFRAPSLYEVAYNTGPFAQPPARGRRLGPEVSRGLEYGVEYIRGAGAGTRTGTGTRNGSHCAHW